MISFNEILKQKAITKVEIAKRMKIEQTNVNRTFERFERNLSEIDSFLSLLNTSLKEQLTGTIEPVVTTTPQYAMDVIKVQAETILLQQRHIEMLIGSKKVKSA